MNTKVFTIRLDVDTYNYLKSLKAETVRKILLKYQKGLLHEMELDSPFPQGNGSPPLAQEPNSLCPFLVDDPKDKDYVWCEFKRIPRAVCNQTRERHDYMGHNCYPQQKKRSPRPKPKNSEAEETEIIPHPIGTTIAPVRRRW